MFTSPAWTLWLGLAGALLTGFCLQLWARNARLAGAGGSFAARLVGNLALAVALGFIMLIAARELMGL